MKKIVLLIGLIGILMTPIVKAQESEEEVEYERSYNQLLQGGFSFGFYGYGYTGTRTGFTFPISASYEMFVSDDFSVGGLVGYSSYRYEISGDNHYRWTFIDFGARASYHYIPLLNELTDSDFDQEKWDFYISMMLIFENRTFSSNDNLYRDHYDDEFALRLGPVAGFRYKFSENLAVYFEGGRGAFGYGNLGITFMF